MYKVKKAYGKQENKLEKMGEVKVFMPSSSEPKLPLRGSCRNDLYRTAASLSVTLYLIKLN
jgi:hypothetical protein